MSDSKKPFTSSRIDGSDLRQPGSAPAAAPGARVQPFEPSERLARILDNAPDEQARQAAVLAGLAAADLRDFLARLHAQVAEVWNAWREQAEAMARERALMLHWPLQGVHTASLVLERLDAVAARAKVRGVLCAEHAESDVERIAGQLGVECLVCGLKKERGKGRRVLRQAQFEQRRADDAALQVLELRGRLAEAQRQLRAEVVALTAAMPALKTQLTAENAAPSENQTPPDAEPSE